ncbi:fatty acid desaturase family protein [Micromonospora qiuiae]|nr:fatty acid desaturase [Micromonospora qiuiae]
MFTLHSSFVGVAVGICLIGLIFAHALELQHEALHGLAFRSRRANEIAGICLGLPMLVSFADYQVSHLRHHRDLGTDRNREFFDYGDQYGAGNRGRASRFALLTVRFLMFNHYRQFVAKLWLTVTGRQFPGETPVSSRRIRRDHLVILGVLALTAALSVAVGEPLVLTAWLLPLVLVACPVHALIELPEHYGCQTDTQEVFLNTRTVRTNRIVVWFVNANNYHVEHHLKPRAPFSELPSLHREVAPQSAHVSDGYRRILPDLLGAMWRPKTDREAA